jgi:hypothetical protein
MRLRGVERYLRCMNSHDYRWQDMVLPERRTAVDLVCSLLAALLLGFALFGSSSDGPHSPARTAIRLPVPVEQAPSLAKSAKSPVIPRTEDWLGRREITGP